MGSKEKRTGAPESLALKLITVFLAVIFIVGCVLAFAACNKQEAKPKLKLLFSDEFEGDEINSEKWLVSGEDAPDGLIRRGGLWTKDSVSLEDGKLVIRTTYGEDKVFRAGAVNAKQQMAYGYYEAKCKLPEAYGLWSAFWIMCDKVHQEIPDATVGGAEIDIYESPFYKSGSVQHAIHTAGYGAKHQENSKSFIKLQTQTENANANGYAEWHTFAVDWQPDSYKFYIDGELSWETVAPYGRKGKPGYIEKNVSSVPGYIIFSVEVGGLGGQPGDSPFFMGGNPINDNKLIFDMNNFSVDFLVDYVKVWNVNPYV